MPPKTKKLKMSTSTSANSRQETSTSASSMRDLINKVKLDREQCAENITDFNFIKKRVRILSTATDVTSNAQGIVYWMSRDQRIQDNWAFLFAQKLALKNKVPLYVCFCLVTKFLDATIRHFDFMLKGLEGVEQECMELNVEFRLLHGQANDALIKFIKENNIGAVVTDFSPLRTPMGWVEALKKSLPDDIPLCQVDAHNIVPCWEASPKLEYAARTIRSKINNQLKVYLTPFPPVVPHPYKGKRPKSKQTDWTAAMKSLEVDQSVGPVSWAKPGYSGAMEVLNSFLTTRLKGFHNSRNDPTKDNLSNLSPWFHFGQISVQRAILCVQEYKQKFPESVAAFCEEAIIRRELSDNFCFYNDKYDQVEGTNAWAKESLNAHRKDKRQYLYTLEELDTSHTHDDLWNAAQTQLVREGKMHGFLRMYWAKKILEWTESPDQALEYAIYLNDRYNLDGRDPNGYVGCMWSICGIHDQGWKERAIFGKIRYMNYQGCTRKFDVPLFVSKWNQKSRG